MNATTLKKVSEAIQLLDVRLADDFEEAHLEGAVNNCVFDVTFDDRLVGTAPDPAKLTVIYGANSHSHEAMMAAEKLERLGYARVEILEGGFAEARQILLVVEGRPRPAPAPAPDGRYVIDIEKSFVNWTGRNLLNKHTGKIGICSGELAFIQGSVIGGRIVLNPAELSCDDLEGEMHDVLIAHLKSHDFLDVEKYPEIRVEITGGGGDLIHADLTVKGVTQHVTIPIAAGLTPEGLPAAQGVLSIDRTEWNILYGSKRFFHRLAGHMVNDTIEIEVRIVARR